MNNIHPIMARALSPFVPPKPHQVFVVKICVIGETIEREIIAPSSMAAISRAIELLFDDDDECPAEGLTISCKVAE